jgi:kumamolisin
MSFHRFLTPAQFKRSYGPSAAAVVAVETFLSRSGIRVEGVSSTNRLIRATAPVSVLEKAFGVTINDYNLNGSTVYSASANPSIPTALSSSVMAIMGLDNAVMLSPHLVSPVSTPVAHAAVVTPSPRIAPSGFSPQQIATAYNWPSLTDTTKATNSTIAILTAYSFEMTDLNLFWSTYGLPPHSVTQKPIEGLAATRALNDETTLDIERSSAMSPGSKILVYGIPVPALTYFAIAMDQIVGDGLAQVVSTSWGGPESTNGFELSNAEGVEDESFQQAVAQGMVIVAAAGDGGAADRTASKDVADFPASDPYVVAAGGTHLVLNNDNSIASESAWSDAGGADSILFAEPQYEINAGLTVDLNIADGVNGDCTADFTVFLPIDGCDGAASPDNTASRMSSDISMDADPATGYSLYYNGRWAVFGGTSFVAPEIAGLFAIAVTQNGGPLLPANLTLGGNTLIYCVGGGLNYATDFNDITSGANSPSLTGTFEAGVGWDHPTGWGSPKNAASLITDLIGCIPAPI